MPPPLPINLILCTGTILKILQKKTLGMLSSPRAITSTALGKSSFMLTFTTQLAKFLALDLSMIFYMISILVATLHVDTYM